MSDRIRNRVREMRREKGLTQADLASAMDVSRQTIISIEGGKYTPSLPLALKISKYFEAGTDDIFSLEE